MQDTIEREITVNAPKERVYKALTDPKEIITWFPDAIEGTLEVGQRPTLSFTEQQHKTQLYIEAAEPFEYFAFRWVPGSTGLVGDVLVVPSTLVEFHIEETGEGTKITLKESGFSSLSSDVAEKSFNQNSGGWAHMMGRLEKVVNQG